MPNAISYGHLIGSAGLLMSGAALLKSSDLTWAPTSLACCAALALLAGFAIASGIAMDRFVIWYGNNPDMTDSTPLQDIAHTLIGLLPGLVFVPAVASRPLAVVILAVICVSHRVWLLRRES